MSANAPLPPADRLQRQVNRFYSLLDLTYLNSQVLACPDTYYVSVSVVCDIDCPFCPRQHYQDVKSGLMKLEAFRRLVPALKLASRVGLYGLGEPFLHPRFFDMCALVKDEDNFVFTSSHGGTIDEKMAHTIMDSGMDELDLSIDAPHERLFRQLRGGLSLKQVVGNVDYLNKLKHERASERPHLYVACALSQHNLPHMKAMVRLTRRLQAERLVFTNLIIIRREDEQLAVWEDEQFRRQLSAAQRLGKRLGIEVLYFYQPPVEWLRGWRPGMADSSHYGCPMLWGNLIVEKEGKVRPCCYLEPEFGNLFEQSIEELRNSEQLCHLRQQMREGNPPEVCQRCGVLLKISPQDSEAYVKAAADFLVSHSFPEAIKKAMTAQLAEYTQLVRTRS